MAYGVSTWLLSCAAHIQHVQRSCRDRGSMNPFVCAIKQFLDRQDGDACWHLISSARLKRGTSPCFQKYAEGSPFLYLNTSYVTGPEPALSNCQNFNSATGINQTKKTGRSQPARPNVYAGPGKS